MDSRDFDPNYLPLEADYEKIAKEQREAWEKEHPTSAAATNKSIIIERNYAVDQP